MLPSSIRWRLPLTYAAVSLLATLCLGLVLVLVLNDYYAGLEARYLEQNAQSVSIALTDLMSPATEISALELEQLVQSQVDTFSYLTETRIDVYSSHGELIASSGDPLELQAVATLSLEVQTGETSQSFSQTLDSERSGEDYSTLLVIENDGTRYVSRRSVSGNELNILDEFSNLLLPVNTPARFLLGAASDEEPRSRLTYRQEIPGVREGLGGAAAGYVELSSGPAFGRPVLETVLWGLAIAGFIAVILATATGWLISLRLSRPILALTAVTSRMAAGDLTTRAEANRHDELGLLAGSFNGMAERVEATVNSLRRFVADAAHELNTPLTALRTNLDLATRITPDNRYLPLAEAQTLRLQKLNDDLLRLSHLDSGLSEDAFRPIELIQLLAERNEYYAAQAEQHDLAFFAYMPGARLMINGNSEYLTRATDNLIDNAIKFTPAGGQIELRLRADRKWAILELSDTGIGIAKEEANFLFNRFRRGSNASDYSGSGLGLAIVKTIVDAHGGDVSITGDSRGSLVVVRLPVIQA